ncbi:hypothetical protein C8F01DRAFT_1369145 [Mycena amicta]|nr:hypothetical protein C8F01DRAFT_1369145 [Mycena amicta]
MSPTRDRIPPEIWSEVFGELDKELDKNALQALCLSNRAFARLARPRLFSSFCFHPHASSSDNGASAQRMLPSAAKAEEYLKRLDFWLSVEIAPLVRSCTIVPWSPIETKYYGPFTESDNPNSLMEVFAEGLARLSRLQSLSFFRANLGDAIFSTLSHLSSLRELRIGSCETAISHPVLLPSTGSPRISSITLHSSLTAPETDPIQPWLPFLDPRHLRVVRLDSGWSTWNESSEMIPVFDGVVRLELTVSESSSALFSILDKFSAVQDLEVVTWDPADLTDPVKRAFAVGCRPFIGSLKKLNATHDLLPILLPQASSVTHLIHGISHTIVRENDVSTTPISRLFSDIATTSALPAGIAAFVFTCRLYYYGYQQPPTPSVDVVSFRDAFVAQYPALTSLRLDANDFLITWRRNPGGYIEEYATDDAQEAKTWREKHKMP